MSFKKKSAQKEQILLNCVASLFPLQFNYLMLNQLMDLTPYTHTHTRTHIHTDTHKLFFPTHHLWESNGEWERKQCKQYIQQFWIETTLKVLLVFPDRLHLLAITLFLLHLSSFPDFPGSSDGKVSAYNARDPGSVPGSGRSPGVGNGNPLQYSCLENPMDKGAW